MAGDIPDEQLVSLVAGLAVSHFAIHPQLRQDLADEVWRRDLHDWVAVRAHEAVNQAIADLLRRPPYGSDDDGEGWPARPHLAAVSDFAARPDDV